MIIFTVHEPQPPARAVEDRADKIVFVKEGFTIWGFIFGLLWLLYNRLWLEAIAALVLTSALAALLYQAGLGQQAAFIVDLLLALIVGFEGNNIWRWNLERRGYALLASVAGRNRLDCERRFFDAWIPKAAAEAKGGGKTTFLNLKNPAAWQTSPTIGTWPEATT